MHVRGLTLAKGAPEEARSADAGATGATGRDGLVTRPVCLTDETVPFFVDWLTVSQVHPEGGLPLVDAGVVWRTDEDGAVRWRTVVAAKHEGSFDTHLSVKCDGSRVTLSGNLSRFGRPDNLFGFGLNACLRICDRVLATYGLPPFTAGYRIERVSRGHVKTEWTGARISRLDLTANFEAGSAEAAHLVMQYLGTQHNGRKKGQAYGDGETVDWGRGSRRQYWKVYVKHLELRRHASVEGYDDKVAAHCERVGLLRLEGTIRSNALTDLGCAFLGDYEAGWSMGQLVNLFQENAGVMTRAERSTDDLDELPRHLRATARDYLAGMDVRSTLSRPTFYRHRRELLTYGLDIAMRNVSPFQPRVRVVELTPATVPSWYQLAAA